MSKDTEEDEEIYVYLDFNEKLPPSIFHNKFFLRIANLDKPTPLVQLNDQIFKGTYDESIGTNLFFEEIENPPLKTNVFEKETPIQLQYSLAQTKILKLKQVKLAKKVSTKENQEFVDINLNQDYRETLDKLEQGVLNIEDLVTENQGVVVEQGKEQEAESDKSKKNSQTSTDSNVRKTLENKCANALLLEKYEKLKQLARIPVRRMKADESLKESETVEESSMVEKRLN